MGVRVEQMVMRRENICNLETFIIFVVSLERIIGLLYPSLMICCVTLDILRNSSMLAVSIYPSS